MGEGYFVGPLEKLQCRNCGILAGRRVVNPKKKPLCSNCGDTGVEDKVKDKK